MSREFFLPPALEVAPRLLGAHLTVHAPRSMRTAAPEHIAPEHTALEHTAPVTIRITEVEAYHGVGTPGPYDPGSHSRDRRTERNASMFGPPGHAYVYLSYGLHFALNLVCSPEGTASGVLIRAGEVVAGTEVARARREAKRGRASRRLPGEESAPIPHRLLARGPGNVGTALGIDRAAHDGHDLFTEPFAFELPDDPLDASEIRRGPRVGVSGVAGGAAYPWRFWIAGDPSVSAYRPGRNVPVPVPGA